MFFPANLINCFATCVCYFYLILVFFCYFSYNSAPFSSLLSAFQIELAVTVLPIKYFQFHFSIFQLNISARSIYTSISAGNAISLVLVLIKAVLSRKQSVKEITGQFSSGMILINHQKPLPIHIKHFFSFL